MPDDEVQPLHQAKAAGSTSTDLLDTGRGAADHEETARPREQGRVLVAAFVAAVMVLTVGACAWWYITKDDLGEGIAFRAYSMDVGKEDLAQQARTLHALYGVEKPSDAKELAKFWRDLAKSMALARVIDHAARERHLSVPSAETRAALDKYVASNYGEGADGREAFVQALGTQGTSEPAVLKELSRQLLVSRLYDSVTASVQAPSAGAIAAAYADRECELRVPEERRIRNIVTITRAQAQAALDRVKGGRAFAAVARSASADQSTPNAGGDLGFVRRDQLEEQYGNAAFRGRPGQLFGPVRTRYGWNVGQVVRVRPAFVPTEANSAKALGEILLTEARSKVWQGWISHQLRNADVRYAAGYRPADPYSAPAPVLPTSNQGCSQ